MPTPVPSPLAGMIKTLDIGKMFGAPVMAGVDAQFAISNRMAEFIQKVGLNEDGSVKMVRFEYSQAELDGDGNPTGKNVKRVIDAPFIAIIPLPNLSVDKIKVNFDLEISTAEESKSSTEAKASMSGKLGFAWWSVKFSGSVTHKSEQTRKTDTRAKYTVELEVGRGATPEGLQRVFDAIMNATGKPIEADKAPKLTGPK